MKTFGTHLLNSYNVMVIAIVYLVFGLTSSYIINKLSLPAYDLSKICLTRQIVVEVAVTVFVAYLIHMIVETIPLPLLGTPEEQEAARRRAQQSGIIIAFAMFVLQRNLVDKIQVLFNSA